MNVLHQRGEPNMNIRSDDFVLEIGSGHNPKIRSDVLCDKFIDDDTQRGGNIVTDRPILEADGEYLPFADGSFDYVICSHVLEHVEEPDRLIAELMRVASRGYIETPSEIAERLYGWPYHNWLVNLIDGRLVIQKKVTRDQFGQLFHALAAHDKNFARFHVTHHSLFLVQYEWVGKIDYQILPPDTSPLDLESAEMIEAVLSRVACISPWQKWLSLVKRAVPRQLVFKAKSMLVKQRRQSKKTLQEIVVCPVCKGAVEWETDQIHCDHC
ncbi:MAG: methyltransferase domain-containing protein, partial [Candidatus Poribacteria bacterium]|nr:methyltransferase domain-containing protein [Candidatus Poribacteria bacterium]